PQTRAGLKPPSACHDVVDNARRAPQSMRNLPNGFAPPPACPQLVPITPRHPGPTHTHADSDRIWCCVDGLNSPNTFGPNGFSNVLLPSGLLSRRERLRGILNYYYRSAAPA